MTNGQMALIKIRSNIIKLRELRDILIEVNERTLDMENFKRTHAIEFSKMEEKEYKKAYQNMMKLHEEIQEILWNE